MYLDIVTDYTQQTKASLRNIAQHKPVIQPRVKSMNSMPSMDGIETTSGFDCTLSMMHNSQQMPSRQSSRIHTQVGTSLPTGRNSKLGALPDDLGSNTALKSPAAHLSCRQISVQLTPD